MHRLAAAVLPLGLFVALTTGCSAVNPLADYLGAPGEPGSNGTNTANTAGDEGTGADAAAWPSPKYDASPPPTPVHHHDGGAPIAHDAGATPAPSGGDGDGPSAYPDAGGDGSAGWGEWDANTAEDAGSPPSADAGAGGDAGGSVTAAVAACEEGVNSLRAQNGLSPLTSSTALESFGAQAAASDAQSGQEDGYFEGSNGGGVSSAEDEFDGDQVDPGGSALDVFDQGLIDEENGEIDGVNDLLNASFTQVGCGVAVASDGDYWVTIEYQ